MPVGCYPGLFLLYISRVSFQFWPRLSFGLGIPCSSLSRGLWQASQIQVLKAKLAADKKAKQNGSKRRWGHSWSKGNRGGAPRASVTGTGQPLPGWLSAHVSPWARGPFTFLFGLHASQSTRVTGEGVRAPLPLHSWWERGRLSSCTDLHMHRSSHTHIFMCTDLRSCIFLLQNCPGNNFLFGRKLNACCIHPAESAAVGKNGVDESLEVR